VEERPEASSALQHVLRLISFKRPAIRMFDEDGHSVSLDKLRRFALAHAEETAGADSAKLSDRLASAAPR
jgi:hypothetical protein